MKLKYVFILGDVAINEGASREFSGCPFVLMPSGYPEKINEYLQELWIGSWCAGIATPLDSASGAPFGFGRRYRPLPSSVRETANRLVNYLHWCADHKMHHGKGVLDPISVSEKDIARLGDQMEAGLWSSDHKSLSPTTIGQRQLAIIHFLQWASARGYAPKAEFTSTLAARKIATSNGGSCTTLQHRLLVVRRAQPREVRFPTEAEVKSAMAAVTDSALQIGMRLVFFCGLRADEVCRLTVADVIDEKVSAGGQRFIRVLGKGRKRRSVEIDTDLLNHILDYIEFERPIRLHRRGTKGDALLINEHTGRRFQYRAFWQGFRKCKRDVSPHLGRHWYAVMYLLRAWRREEVKAERKGVAIATDMMHSLLSIDLIRLQQNLGHAYLSTTERYLVALDQFIDKADLAMSFQDMIDGQYLGGLNG
ncbi:tyrosine-type recombinase/integrase [Paracoccus alkanivorans]|uniref:Site-specific integrase n=1 Tax=Paracoccus alkanivorans TaxID=2116655 RepID=A0A3M0MB88_9RHOB|nr:site-specific integrase [Paracoccus alkanivorans]RMC32860.1 site-specific integrase [Paracoccus alkanivorans]